jgi:hypothetical protein
MQIGQAPTEEADTETVAAVNLKWGGLFSRQPPSGRLFFAISPFSTTPSPTVSIT